MFIPGTLTVEYDDPDGGAVLKTDEGTEGAAICANVTLDNGILRATGPDFASADDGSSVGLRGRLTTHGSSVEAQLTCPHRAYARLWSVLRQAGQWPGRHLDHGTGQGDRPAARPRPEPTTATACTWITAPSMRWSWTALS